MGNSARTLKKEASPTQDNSTNAATADENREAASEISYRSKGRSSSLIALCSDVASESDSSVSSGAAPTAPAAATSQPVITDTVCEVPVDAEIPILETTSTTEACENDATAALAERVSAMAISSSDVTASQSEEQVKEELEEIKLEYETLVSTEEVQNKEMKEVSEGEDSNAIGEAVELEQVKVREVYKEDEQMVIGEVKAETEEDALASNLEQVELVVSPPSPVTRESLTVISISNEKRKLDKESDVSDLVSLIEEHTGEIKTIHLDGNTIGVAAGKALADAMAKASNVEEVYVNDCFTGRKKDEVHVVLECFAQSLKDKQSLRIFNVSDNALGPIGAKAISPLLSTRPSLTHLYINNCGLGPEGGKVIASALLSLLSVADGPVALRCIQMGRNRLENGSAPYLSEAFARFGVLEEVALPQCGIRPEGIAVLSKGLAQNPRLKKINLQDNTFTKVASLEYAKALKSLAELEDLDLGDCLLADEGVSAILEALVEGGSSKCIQRLNLQYAEIKDNGALTMLNRLLAQDGKFPSLKEIMLNGNEFDPEGETALTLLKYFSEQNITVDEWDEMDYGDDESDESEHYDEESEDEKGKSGAIQSDADDNNELEEKVEEVNDGVATADIDGSDLVQEMDKLEIKNESPKTDENSLLSLD